jgi:hypothetical protein
MTVRDDDGNEYVPAGYAETMDCMKMQQTCRQGRGNANRQRSQGVVQNASRLSLTTTNPGEQDNDHRLLRRVSMRSLQAGDC